LKIYRNIQLLKGVLAHKQSGQDLVEYALVVSLIALAVTASMGSVAKSISTALMHIGSHLATYTS
jgi:Flp pilus assembly pilin Flp